VIKFQIPNPRHQTNPKFQNQNNYETVVGQGFCLAIYDVTGRMVREFSRLTVNGERSTIVWFGDDDSGRKLPSGVYLIRLETDGFKKTEKVILLK